MRVFVTGATGFIGEALIPELLNHGHHVVALARSDRSAEALSKAGVEVVRGDLEDLECLKRAAKDSDGVIHLAFLLDFAAFDNSVKIDQAAIMAMGEAMAGTSKPLVIASGTLMLPQGQLSTEDTDPDWSTPLSNRTRAETIVKTTLKDMGVRSSAVRLSPTVHGKGDKGFVPMFTDAARKNGFVTFVGDGSGQWPAVHRDDAASLFRLALEKSPPGSIWHATAEQGVRTGDTLETIARKLNLPVETKSVEEAMKLIGFLGSVIDLNVPVSCEKTKKELGWEPKQIGFIADIEQNYVL